MSVNSKPNVVALTAPVSAEIVPIIPAAPNAASPVPAAKMPFTVRLRAGIRCLLQKSIPALLGAMVLIALWQIAAISSKGFPTPLKTWEAAKVIFADPFYIAGPNDMGIGWNVLASLKRVATGFGLAALVGIPAGFLIGRFSFIASMLNPVISLLRPVSPLAWLPIGLLLFQRAEPASAWTIFICSIWPMILNTAEGVKRIPQDYLNVARVLKLSEFTVMHKILFFCRAAIHPDRCAFVDWYCLAGDCRR